MEKDRREMLFSLCAEYTDLDESDIQLLAHLSEKLPFYSLAKNADVFINCLCKNGEEAIVVAEAIREDSLYEFSTIGYMIRRENEPAVLRSLHYGIETEEVRATTYASSENNTVVQSVFPIKRADRIIGVLIYEYEYSDYGDYLNRIDRPYPAYKEASPLTPAYLTNLDWVGACVEDALLVIDHKGCVRYRNTAAQQLYYDYGFVQDICNKEYRKLSLNGAFVPRHSKDKVLREELTIRDHTYMCSQYWIETPENGFFVVNLHDITQEKYSETLARLKEVTLHEIQHRIKNNLFTIYSLLDMKKRRLQSPEATDALQDAMNRIISIAGTYEEASKGADASVVSLRQCLARIKSHFEEIYRADECNVTVTVAGDDTALSSDTASYVLLVVNELVQNCYKYAFPQRCSGEIRIDIACSAVEKTISVSDNGVGIDPCLLERRREDGAMGMEIAEMIVQEKLRGKLHTSSDSRGCRVWFDFTIR